MFKLLRRLSGVVKSEKIEPSDRKNEDIEKVAEGYGIPSNILFSDDMNDQATVTKSRGLSLAGGDHVKQKVSLHHVVYNIYYSAPVKVSAKFYPRGSNRPATEKYLWVELDEAVLDARQAALDGGGGFAGEQTPSNSINTQNLWI